METCSPQFFVLEDGALAAEKEDTVDGAAGNPSDVTTGSPQHRTRPSRYPVSKEASGDAAQTLALS